MPNLSGNFPPIAGLPTSCHKVCSYPGESHLANRDWPFLPGRVQMHSVSPVVLPSLLTSGLALIYIEYNMYVELYLLGYRKGCDFFQSLQSLSALSMMHITFWLNAYPTRKPLSFSSYLVERFSGVGKDFVFNYISPTVQRLEIQTQSWNWGVLRYLIWTDKIGAERHSKKKKIKLRNGIVECESKGADTGFRKWEMNQR